MCWALGYVFCPCDFIEPLQLCRLHLLVCLTEGFRDLRGPRKDANLGLSDFMEDDLTPMLLPRNGFKQRNEVVITTL